MLRFDEELKQIKNVVGPFADEPKSKYGELKLTDDLKEVTDYLNEIKDIKAE